MSDTAVEISAKAKRRAEPLFVAVSLLFGVVQVCGNLTSKFDSLDALASDGLQAAICCALALGCACVCYACLVLLRRALKKPATSARRADLLQRKPFALSFAVLMTVYLAWAAVYYPGDISLDTYASLNSAFRYILPSNAHPMLFNWIIGGCVALGRALGSDNLGIFIFVLMQATACAAVYAYVSASAMRAGMRILAIASLAFYALTPAFGMFAVLGNKDTLFAVGMCLLILNSYRAIREPQSLRFWVGLAVTAVLVSLLRHGAFIIAFALCLSAALISARKKALLCRLALIASGLALVLGFNCALLPSMGIESVNQYEMLSLPFQQAARVVRDADDTLDDRERAALDALLDTKQMSDLYCPWNADYIKGLAYNHMLAERERQTKILDFLSISKDLLVKHPRIYLEAFIAHTNEYYTFITGEGHYDMRFLGGIEYEAGTNMNRFSFSSPERLAGARALLADYGESFRRAPVIGLLHQYSFYTWLIIGLLACALVERRRAAALLLLAPICVLIGCLCSPINGYFRYFLSIIACTPVCVAIVRSELTRDASSKTKKTVLEA